jgi:hypothetical protein
MNRSRFTVRNEPFPCIHCGTAVQPLQNGSCRNHCPQCFHSLHVDILPGDRSANCGGVMKPTGFDYHPKKGWMVVHQCIACGHQTRNKLAFDDPLQPDSYTNMLNWMRRLSF